MIALVMIIILVFDECDSNEDNGKVYAIHVCHTLFMYCSVYVCRMMHTSIDNDDIKQLWAHIAMSMTHNSKTIMLATKHHTSTGHERRIIGQLKWIRVSDRFIIQ